MAPFVRPTSVAKKLPLRNNPAALARNHANTHAIAATINNPTGSNSNSRLNNRAQPNTTPVKPWLHAVSLFPPAQPPLRHIIPTEVGHFTPQEPSQQQQQPSQIQSSKRIQKRSRPTNARTLFPPVITYPEDSLRAQFYEMHPWEKVRPISLVETEQGLLENLHDNGSMDMKDKADYLRTHKKTVKGEVILRGEDVIKRAAYLQTKEGGSYSPQIAYSLALASFYRARVSQETDALHAKQQLQQKQQQQLAQMQKTGSEEAMPIVESEGERQVRWFKEREEKSVADSIKYLSVLDAQRAEKKLIQSQVSQYEARNMKKDSTGEAKN